MENIIMIVDALSAKLAVITFVVVVIKVLTKRFTKVGLIPAEKLDKTMMKLHKPAGYIMVVASTIHGILSIRNIPQFGLLVTISGLICLICSIGAIASFMYRKKLPNIKEWLNIHRMLTVVAVVSLFVHLLLLKV